MNGKIAIVGSGQLAQMMAQEGIPMGMQFSFLAEEKEDTRCVDALGKVVIRKDDMDAQALYEALGQPDVITVEKEHVDIDLLSSLQAICPVHPNPNALDKFKNRRIEKQYLQSLGIPIAPFHAITSADDLKKAHGELNKPIFLKSEEEGYDGYNQFKVTEDNLDEVIGQMTFPCKWVAESFIPFQREVSFLAARCTTGEIKFYPAVENYHSHGTLLTSLAPAPALSADLEKTGQEYMRKLFESLDYVGMMCMECFLCDDQLLVNEIAPRVHNSGHWTYKGALTSQFENHVRAVAGLDLGDTKTFGISGMLNLLGVVVSADEACAHQGFLTLYGKSIRPRRKLGHVTINGESYEDVRERLATLEKLAYKEA